jgi:hypothetical protein
MDLATGRKIIEKCLVAYLEGTISLYIFAVLCLQCGGLHEGIMWFRELIPYEIRSQAADRVKSGNLPQNTEKDLLEILLTTTSDKTPMKPLIEDIKPVS